MRIHNLQEFSFSICPQLSCSGMYLLIEWGQSCNFVFVTNGCYWHTIALGLDQDLMFGTARPTQAKNTRLCSSQSNDWIYCCTPPFLKIETDTLFCVVSWKCTTLWKIMSSTFLKKVAYNSFWRRCFLINSLIWYFCRFKLDLDLNSLKEKEQEPKKVVKTVRTFREEADSTTFENVTSESGSMKQRSHFWNIHNELMIFVSFRKWNRICQEWNGNFKRNTTNSSFTNESKTSYSYEPNNWRIHSIKSSSYDSFCYER